SGVADTYTAVKNTPLVVTVTTANTTTTDTILPLSAPDWHYFDSLVLGERNLGTAWRTTGYVEDANWKVGAAELGYGDAGTAGAEVTVIADNPTPGYTTGATDRFASYYFRR